MSIISLILIIFSVLVVDITGEEKFCAKDRKLLLGGIFNYDKLVFGYSWKEVSSVQLWLVWSFEIKDNRLVPIGKDMTVDQVFPGIPLFRCGFGLTLKCDNKDTICQSYRQLVFIFFQTSYKVFRFSNNVFAVEADKSKIPWGLNTRGEATDWFFGDPSMDLINSIMFLSGYQSQIFIASRNTLFATSVTLKATSLKWAKLAQSEEFTNTLGGFIIGSDLFINKNEAQDSVLMKYDQSGKQLKKISVWEYFECDKVVKESAAENGVPSGRNIAGEAEIATNKDKDDGLAAILLVCIIVAIVLVDIIVGAFWLTIYMRNKSSNEA